jgi:hypothetical protein
MNIYEARVLLTEIESLLYSGTGWDVFWRNFLNEIRAGDVDGLFHEALAKLHALGALDKDLNDFISVFIRSQIQRFYQDLYKTRRWHLTNGHVYTFSDVIKFVEKSHELIRQIRRKVEQINDESSKLSNEFSEYKCEQRVMHQRDIIQEDKVSPSEASLRQAIMDKSDRERIEFWRARGVILDKHKIS